MATVSYIKKQYGDYKIPANVYDIINRRLQMIIDGKISLTWLLSALGGMAFFLISSVIAGALWMNDTRVMILQQNSVVNELKTRMDIKDKEGQATNLSLARIQEQQGYMKEQMGILIGTNNQILSTLNRRSD